MLNIALDGPSGSGKSTVAGILAKKLDILHLDTGAMYRACALEALKRNIDCLDEDAVKGFISDIDLVIKYENGGQKTILDGEDVSLKIRDNKVSLMSSNISSLPIVREKMVEMLCVNPAKIAGIYPKKGVIAVGSDADIAIIDEADSSVISTSTMRGICDFSPFEGYEVCGKVWKVIAGGEVIVSDGKLNAKQGRGKLMTRKRFNPF